MLIGGVSGDQHGKSDSVLIDPSGTNTGRVPNLPKNIFFAAAAVRLKENGGLIVVCGGYEGRRLKMFSSENHTEVCS